jgi:citrate lyase beta subunit
MPWQPRPHASFRSPSAARRTAISIPISAARGRSTGPKCCTRVRTRCWRPAPRASIRRSTACSPIRDAEGFERDTALSRRLGYRGRKLIHPGQIEPCNRLYRPSAAELDYYARVLEAFDHAVAQGSASTTVDGRMIDLAMANAARRVLDAESAWKKAG